MTTTPVEVDLRAKVVNVRAMSGDAWSIKVTWTGQDLTGHTIEAQLRHRPDSTDALDLAITESDLAGGEFYIGQTEATESGYYDVQITPPAGLPRTYLRGRLSLTADMTHD